MTRRLMVLLGTKKGAFLLDVAPERRADPGAWRLRGPFCEAWPLNHLVFDPATGAIHGAGGNPWFGPAVWRSDDLGGTWSHASEGLTFGEGEPAVTNVWRVTPAHGALYAGVEPAGLFRSTDGGRSWSHVAGLRAHPSRPGWMEGAGGLICHTILAHPNDPLRMWVAISAAGCFATEDGGLTWEARNRGVAADFLPDPDPETGQCVHRIAHAAGDPERLWQQNHCGVYRSDDAGRSWVRLDAPLPSEFGFAIVAHPRDRDAAFTIPLKDPDQGRFMPDARMAVWATGDGGSTWEARRTGLPQENAYLSVLRGAFASDPLTPFGLYAGTSSGALFASADEGGTWTRIIDLLPPIHSVETALVDA